MMSFNDFDFIQSIYLLFPTSSSPFFFISYLPFFLDSDYFSGTAQERLTPIINTITRMFFDPKIPEIVSQSSMGEIFMDYLKDFFGLRRGVSAEDDFQSLHDISSHLLTLKDNLREKEYIIQVIGYTLLTIYSNDPINCDILESNYHFLSLLVISLPALNGWDSVSAVLTTLNYVCQCIDTETELPILALCATVSVMTRNALYAETEIETERTLQQLDATCSSFEAIIRGQAKYALQIVEYGIIKWILCDPLVDLDQQLESSRDNVLKVYLRVIDFMIAVHKRGPPNFEMIQTSGLFEAIYRVISSNDNVNTSPIEITKRLLMLLEGLVTADACHMEDVIRFMVRLLDILIPVQILSPLGIIEPRLGIEIGSSNVEKISCLCHSISRIIEESKKGYSVWYDFCGLQYLISIICRLKGVFITGPCPGLLLSINQPLSAFMIAKSSRSSSLRSTMTKSKSLSSKINISSSSSSLSTSSSSSSSSLLKSKYSSCNNIDISQIDDSSPEQILTYLDLLISLTDCISTEFKIFSRKDKTTKDFEIFFQKFRKNYILLVDAIISTNIFSSAHAGWGIRILFGLLKGNFKEPSDPKTSLPYNPNANINTNTNTSTILPSRKSSSVLFSAFSSTDSVVNPEAVEVIIETLLQIPIIVSIRITEILQTIAEGSEKSKYTM